MMFLVDPLAKKGLQALLSESKTDYFDESGVFHYSDNPVNDLMTKLLVDAGNFIGVGDDLYNTLTGKKSHNQQVQSKLEELQMKGEEEAQELLNKYYNEMFDQIKTETKATVDYYNALVDDLKDKGYRVPNDLRQALSNALDNISKRYQELNFNMNDLNQSVENLSSYGRSAFSESRTIIDAKANKIRTAMKQVSNDITKAGELKERIQIASNDLNSLVGSKLDDKDDEVTKIEDKAFDIINQVKDFTEQPKVEISTEESKQGGLTNV